MSSKWLTVSFSFFMEWENQFFEDTSFFWYNSVNGVPCRYKSVNGVFFVGIKALTALAALTPLYRKNSGVFPKKFDPGRRKWNQEKEALIILEPPGGNEIKKKKQQFSLSQLLNQSYRGPRKVKMQSFFYRTLHNWQKILDGDFIRIIWSGNSENSAFERQQM